MQFYLHGSSREHDIEGVVARAVSAEVLGYEGIFFGDAHMTSLDPFQVMAIAATRTQRLRLGTGVTNMVFRDPTVLASSAATVNEISKGRAILGLGTGDGTTYALGRNATRLAKFEDGLRIIRNLVQGKPIPIAKSKERPEGEIALRVGKFPVPVYISAEGPRGLRIAGKIADGVILGTGFDLRVLQWARDQIAEGAREAGRNPSDIELMAAGIICVDEDATRARNLVRGRLANRAHHNFRFTLETVPPEELPGVKRFMDSFDVTKRVDERSDPNLVTEYLIQRFSIAGTPEECVRRVKVLEEAGIRKLMVTPPPAGYHEVKEAWAKKVMPYVRSSRS